MQPTKPRMSLGSLAALLMSGLESYGRTKKSGSVLNRGRFLKKAKAKDPITGLRRKRPMPRYQQTRGY